MDVIISTDDGEEMNVLHTGSVDRRTSQVLVTFTFPHCLDGMVWVQVRSRRKNQHLRVLCLYATVCGLFEVCMRDVYLFEVRKKTMVLFGFYQAVVYFNYSGYSFDNTNR